MWNDMYNIIYKGKDIIEAVSMMDKGHWCAGFFHAARMWILWSVA